MSRRVAVLGAGGIGRHHANWWNLEGAEVVAILGRNETSVAASAARLKEMFGFSGACYTKLSQLLSEVRPEIVDVATPARLHYRQVDQALRAGCHVLCEKPLHFDHHVDEATLLSQAEALVELAHDAGLLLGLCSQFSIAARTCAALRQERTPAPLQRIIMELRSPERGRSPNPAQTWIDLGPHLIAALQTLLPGHEPAWQTLNVAREGHNAAFSFEMAGSRGVAVELQVGFTNSKPANVRRITLNETTFDLIGEAGPDGHFRIRYRSSAGDDSAQEDPMRLLLREFLAGTPPLDATAALLNQRWLLHLLLALR